ncbi:hypothetical protein J6590_066155 [Homalodisca vitripennis]|nr:hypothetical protein J6590_066155 [Homalodisca vitripennis]
MQEVLSKELCGYDARRFCQKNSVDMTQGGSVKRTLWTCRKEALSKELCGYDARRLCQKNSVDMTQGGSVKILRTNLTQSLKENHKSALFTDRCSDKLNICTVYVSVTTTFLGCKKVPHAFVHSRVITAKPNTGKVVQYADDTTLRQDQVFCVQDLEAITFSELNSCI